MLQENIHIYIYIGTYIYVRISFIQVYIRLTVPNGCGTEVGERYGAAALQNEFG